MKAQVYVTLKQGVLDPAGKAVAQGLHQLGYVEVEGVRLGRYIEMELQDGDPAQARARLEDMCKALLANTVIEDYRIELLPPVSGKGT